MIELGVAEDFERRARGAGLRVRRAEDNPLQPGVDGSAGTHRAGLDCNIEGTPAQTVVPELTSRAALGKNLSVRSRIVQSDRPIVSPRHYPSLVDDDCSHRYFAFECGFASLGQRRSHEALVIGKG